MVYNKSALLFVVGLLAVTILSGCVERYLTINTVPTDALVTLNDEQIGLSPVKVSFNWYGDYNVRISKEGYETLKTHRELDGPWYDKFPFDFFAQVLNSKKIVDSYEWSFELIPKQYPDRNELIDSAAKLQQQIQ